MHELLIGYGVVITVLLVIVYALIRKLIQIQYSLEKIEKELEVLREEVRELREKTDLVREIERLVQHIQVKKEEDRDKVKTFLLKRFSNELAG
jgi:uncharacterized protein YoxC